MKNHAPIVFFSRMPQAVPSLGPVQRHTGGVFISNRLSTLRYFASNYPDLQRMGYIRALPFLRKSHRILSGSRAIVSGAGHRAILARYPAKKIMIFHGTFRALTRQMISTLAGFDHVFLIGPRMERMLLRHGGDLQISYTTSGYIPFSEFPKSNPQLRHEVLQQLRLDPDLPTIFYAPARGECGSWLHCAEGIARQIPEKYNLIMRPHPSQVFGTSIQERRVSRKVSAILSHRGNAVVDMAKCSFQLLMCASDLLIGDATSPNEEFLFYDRPQIITESYPREKWVDQWLGEGLQMDDIEDLLSLYSCGLSFCKDGFDHWGEAVEECLANDSDYAAVRRRYFANAFGSEPGSAAEKVAHKLSELIQA
jgi:hypothetical protein